eukprot:1192499-Pyramimonas_sp.AAC.1
MLTGNISLEIDDYARVSLFDRDEKGEGTSLAGMARIHMNTNGEANPMQLAIEQPERSNPGRGG